MELAGVIEVLAIAACPVIVWLTIGRSLFRVRRWAAHVPVGGPGAGSASRVLARLHGLRITSVLPWEADLLVGFDRASGSWVHPAAPPGETPQVINGLRNFAGALRLPGPAGDQESIRLVEEWWADGRSLLAILKEDGLTVLADTSSRTLVCCRPSP
jgi:hypothetical protein